MRGSSRSSRRRSTTVSWFGGTGRLCWTRRRDTRLGRREGTLWWLSGGKVLFGKGIVFVNESSINTAFGRKGRRGS